jgi:hypothetical protein
LCVTKKIAGAMSGVGHSRPSHFVPVLNNVRYASDSDHSRYESELTLWARSGPSALQQNRSYSITSSARSLLEQTISGLSAMTLETIAPLGDDPTVSFPTIAS